MSRHDSPAWRRETFERYAEARRNARIPGYRLDALPDITRYRPAGADDEALLAFARFPAAAAGGRIRDELQWVRDHGWAAEWKVHDFDQPPDLHILLEAQGLTAHHVEALMVLDVGRAGIAAPAANGIAVEEAAGATLDELAALQEEVWACRLPWLAGVLHAMADPEHGSAAVFCARDGGRVVGSGWIDFHHGSPFAQLCGGAVLESHRERGVYSLLFARRLAEAAARGVPYIAVDAAPMSRPILERKGFAYVCDTYPMRTRKHDTGAVTRA